MKGWLKLLVLGAVPSPRGHRGCGSGSRRGQGIAVDLPQQHVPQELHLRFQRPRWQRGDGAGSVLQRRVASRFFITSG